MLNFPKTGSSFAREVVRSIYWKRNTIIRRLFVKLGIREPIVMDLRLPKIDKGTNHGLLDQHGTLHQIPDRHKKKQIVSIVRNPFSWYVSNYLYKWWEQYLPTDSEVIIEQYPNFPNISFSELYEILHTYEVKKILGTIVPKIELGLITLRFIQFYFKDPEAVFRKIDLDYIENKEYLNDMNEIYFLRQENLNSELKEFLLHIGIDKKELEFINSKEKVNVSNRKKGGSNSEEYYAGTSLKQLILKRDRLLFKIFPEYLPDNNSIT
jgi:hypothetical protein